MKWATGIKGGCTNINIRGALFEPCLEIRRRFQRFRTVDEHGEHEPCTCDTRTALLNVGLPALTPSSAEAEARLAPHRTPQTGSRKGFYTQVSPDSNQHSSLSSGGCRRRGAGQGMELAPQRAACAPCACGHGELRALQHESAGRGLGAQGGRWRGWGLQGAAETASRCL